TPAPPTLYPLSLHDALPISREARPEHGHAVALCREGRERFVPAGGEGQGRAEADARRAIRTARVRRDDRRTVADCDEQEVGRLRSEEHTSELQSRSDLVCRL